MDYIRTRWHRALEAIANKDIVMSTGMSQAERLEDLPRNTFSQVGFDVAVDLCNSAPKFYFDKQVIEAMLERSDQVTKSLVALSQAGVAKLPFPYLLAEYDWGGPCIVLFSESKKHPETPFRATAMQMHRLSGGRDVLAISPQTFFASQVFADQGGHAVVNWAVRIAGWVQENDNARKLADKSVEYWKSVVQTGLMAVLLLLNTRGIAKEAVQAPRALNNTRAKRNRPAIPGHTVVRLGHAYTRSGGTVSASEHARRKQPLGWRAGYTAARWITKRHEKWDETQADDEGKHTILVYVEPYLVNYDPTVDELPDIPERRVAW